MIIPLLTATFLLPVVECKTTGRSYRIIENRKCWFDGPRRGHRKSELYWFNPNPHGDPSWQAPLWDDAEQDVLKPWERKR